MANLIIESELWKDIEGYNGLYQVSLLGNVRSLPRIKKTSYGRIYFTPMKQLKPVKMNNGYFIITLSKDSVLSSKLIHRIVASSFIENPEGLEQVNHINGIKSDNRAANLEWMTRSQNMKHAFATGLAPKCRRVKK